MAKKPAQSPAAEKATPPPEEYLLYARVPRDRDTPAKVGKYLEHIADLLSDDKQHLYVESYEKYTGTKKPKKATKSTAAAAGAEGGGAGGDGTDMNNPDGGDKSALYPMYFCHNKF
jgi:hypothetical protein